MSIWDDIASRGTWRPWMQLRDEFATAIQQSFSAWVAPDQPHFREQLAFAMGRFDEGAGILSHFTRMGEFLGGRTRILDIGAGNGGVAVALANCRDHDVYTLDIIPNRELISVRRALQLPLHNVVATGDRMPFASGSFDIVLLLDTIEHVRQRRAMAREIMRILRAGGVCMVTTPARLRYAFDRDPHYGVRNIALLPNPLQRFIVNRVFRRRVRDADGAEIAAYDVEHLFWHAREIARLFGASTRVQVLFNRQFSPDDGGLGEKVRFRLREFFFDRVLIYKTAAR